MNYMFKSVRQTKGLTQLELAEKSGLTERLICRLETGRWSPTEEVRNRLAAVLDVPANILFGSDEEIAALLDEAADIQVGEYIFHPECLDLFLGMRRLPSPVFKRLILERTRKLEAEQQARAASMPENSADPKPQNTQPQGETNNHE